MVAKVLQVQYKLYQLPKNQQVVILIFNSQLFDIVLFVALCVNVFSMHISGDGY